MSDYSKITNVKQLVALLKERDEQLKKRDDEVNALSKRLEALEAKNSDTGSTSICQRIERLERDGYRQQQYSRRECIELVGLPDDVSGTALEDKVVEVFGQAGVTVTKRDFHAIHRLRNQAVVIAKCVNRRDATAILRAKKKLREVDAAAKTKLGVKGKVYVNESLCPEYRRLFGICTTLFRKKMLASSYTINGTIKVCVNENDDKSTIEHINDLKELFGADEIEDIIKNHKKKSNN